MFPFLQRKWPKCLSQSDLLPVLSQYRLSFFSFVFEGLILTVIPLIMCLYMVIVVITGALHDIFALILDFVEIRSSKRRWSLRAGYELLF